VSTASAHATGIGRTGTFTRRRVASLHARLGRRERRLAWQVAATAAVGLAFCLALVWVRLQVVRTGYQLSTARSVEEKLVQQQRELAIELATLTSPRRLESQARTRLGMQDPEPGQIVTLR
jgi:cell division protein FtsL